MKCFDKHKKTKPVRDITTGKIINEREAVKLENVECYIEKQGKKIIDL